MVDERPSLLADDLHPVWELVRRRLERRGTAPLGRLKLPPLTSASRLTLTTLIGKPPGATLDLAALEHALCELDRRIARRRARRTRFPRLVRTRTPPRRTPSSGGGTRRGS